jgi:hypothetical protein
MWFIEFILDVDYGLCITWIILQQLWGYKVEEKYLGVREQERLNTTALRNQRRLQHKGKTPCSFLGRQLWHVDVCIGYSFSDSGKRRFWLMTGNNLGVHGVVCLFAKIVAELHPLTSPCPSVHQSVENWWVDIREMEPNEILSTLSHFC